MAAKADAEPWVVDVQPRNERLAKVLLSQRERFADGVSAIGNLEAQ
jgi:hypothetical protein